MEGVREGEGRGPARNWTGHYGYIRFDALEPYCVIDRAPHESGHISWRAPGGGERSAGLRPRRIDPGILESRATFFHGLRVSIAEVGIKVPLLVWAINGKAYVRYGASRVHVGLQLGLERAPAIVCSMTPDPTPGFYGIRALTSPADVLDALGPLASVGHFIVDHEMIDIHRAEPWGVDPLP